MKTLLLTALFAAGGSMPTLPPCPRTPNCVSSQASDAHRIEPFRYAGTTEAARERLLAILRSMPRTKVTDTGGDTLRAEFRTRFFRFVDDAIFVFDDARKTIEVRSASRIGRSDFGVNRRRLEEIRKDLGR